jgi:hypothetical protein
MWHNNKQVTRTHAKHSAQQAWAIISGVSNNWLQIQPNAPDGVGNVHMILSTALANNRRVDVLVTNGQITEATLR